MIQFKSPLISWAIPFLGVFLLLRIIFWGLLFPNPDEAYYWLWGQHLEISYYDHPPFHAWIQGLFSRGLGRSNWVLRLPNLFSTGLLLGVYWHICRYLYRERTVELWITTVLLLLASPLFFLFLAIAWPDHWLIVFSTLSGYCLVRFLEGCLASASGDKGDLRWLYGAALALGVAGLCKYNAVFIGLGGIATIAAQPRLRPLLRNPHLYGAAAVTALVLSPILIWNINHDFFSFRYYFERSAGAHRLTLQPFQPFIFLLLCGLILGPLHSWQLIQLARQNRHSRLYSVYESLAWWVFTLSTVSFILLSLVSVAIYYWNILAYPLLLPLLAQRFIKYRSHLASAQLVGGLAAVGLLVHYAVIPLTALGSNADPDSAALYGWNQIAREVRQRTQTLENPLLLTTDYRSAAALAYELNNPDVIAISGRLDQFDFWYDAKTMTHRDALLLGETWHPICPQHLAMMEPIDSPRELTIRRFGLPLQTYRLVAASGFKPGLRDDYPLQPDYPLVGSSDGEDCFGN